MPSSFVITRGSYEQPSGPTNSCSSNSLSQCLHLIDILYNVLNANERNPKGLDDLCVRFIINLPQEELESVERICFQVEEAQWFYEDFIRPLDPDLPSLNLRDFCLRIFQHCPLLSEFSSYHHSAAFSEFLAYKTRVPVRGAIMINQDMTEVVLVKGWKKAASWSFPRGKINKDELDLDCAIREVYEETGFDMKKAGLVGNNDDMKYIDVTMREQHMRLYVFRGVPMDTYFEPRTRKEISKIQWYKLSELPTLKKKKQQSEGRGEDLATNANKFYMVAPFLSPLNKWIAQQRKLDKQSDQEHPHPVTTSAQNTRLPVDDHTSGDGVNTDSTADDMGRLLASLRHSGHASNTTDLPEVSEPLDTRLDVTAQLKGLLHVSSQAASKHVDQRSTAIPGAPGRGTTVGKDSNALLALLRGKETTYEQVPQTPLEQVIGHPALPPAPQRHPHRMPSQGAQALPLQSHLQLPTIHNQLPQFHSRNAVHTSKPPLHIRERLHQSHHRGQLPAQSILPAQHGQQLSKTIESKSSPAGIAHLNRQVPAPYQRTGDPEFSRRSQYSSNLPPSIPPASKLPPPKLTTHSSALLDLFMTNRPTKVISTPQLTGASTTHLSVLSSFEAPHEHSEVSPLTEQSTERELHIQMIPAGEPDQQKSKLAAWGNFQATSKMEISEARRRSAEKDAGRLAEEARTGVRQEPQLPAMSETWRQVKVDDQANQRKVVNVKKSTSQSRNANGTARTSVPFSESNLGELTREFAVDDIGHVRSTPDTLQEDVQPKATAGPKQNLPPVLAVPAKDITSSNPDHKAYLLDLFRKPSIPSEQPPKPSTSLELPGTPVELSALPSPGYNQDTSHTEHATLRYSSHSHENNKGFKPKRPVENGKARKSPMSATINGPLNVPNFDTISQKTKEYKGQTENGAMRNTQKGPPLTILPRPLIPEVVLRVEREKGPATVSPEALQNIDTTPVPFQPQILRRPVKQNLQPQAPPPYAPAQPSDPSKAPPSFDYRTSQNQGHKDALLSLFGNSAPLNPATNSVSAIPISPLSERVISQKGVSAVVSPLTSRSLMGSVVSPIAEGTAKSAGVGILRSPEDRNFLLRYLEEVAKERR